MISRAPSRAETRKASIAWRLGSSERALLTRSPGARDASSEIRLPAIPYDRPSGRPDGWPRLGRRTALCPAPRRRSPPPPIPPIAICKSPSHSLRVCVKRSSAPECDNNPRASRRLMIERTSRLRRGEVGDSAWPASWVAMVRRSASVYITGWAKPSSSVIRAFCTSCQPICSRPPRSAHTGLSKGLARVPSITGE